MSLVTLPASIASAAGRVAFALTRSQQALTTITGVSQITSFADRRWVVRIQINPQFETDLRDWSLAITKLSDISNHFAMGPPHYSGPSTGYSGSNPLVAGAGQLGTSLDVDGLPNSTAILKAGDFLSFDTTSAKSNTNRQLIQVASDVTSNGSGQATIALTVPIRQAPANDVSVNLQTPTALFMLSQAQGGVEVDANLFSAFIIDAVERIFP